MFEKITVSAAVDSFLLAVRHTVSSATLALYRHYLQDFSRFCRGLHLDEITPALVTSWNAKYHPAGCVRRLLRWCVTEARLLAVNPIDGMRFRRNGHRLRIASRAELVSLQRRSDRTFRRFLLAMTETIARPREIRTVRLADIHASGSPAWTVADLVAGRCFFRLARFKGAELRRDRLAVRNIPISPRLGRLIARLMRRPQLPTTPLFLNRSGKPWTCNAVRCRMRRLRDALGLVADAGGEQLVAYSMRHTAATDAVGAGVKGLVLAELMGHSDVRMTQRYVHLRPDHLIEAANQVFEWKQGQKRKNGRPGQRRKPSDDA